MPVTSWPLFSHSSPPLRLPVEPHLTPEQFAVVLETIRNQSLANAAYVSKRPALAASAITTTRQLAEGFDSWTPETLAARQAQMARAATGIWRVSQLS